MPKGSISLRLEETVNKNLNVFNNKSFNNFLNKHNFPLHFIFLGFFFNKSQGSREFMASASGIFL